MNDAWDHHSYYSIGATALVVRFMCLFASHLAENNYYFRSLFDVCESHINITSFVRCQNLFEILNAVYA